MRRVFESLLGGAVVYVVMAACSGAEQAVRVGANDSSGPASGTSGGSTGAGGGSGVDALDASLFDHMTSPVKEASAQSSSGSRIKARWLVSADGAKQFQGWRDIQRNEDCAFIVASDGQQRCMPISATNASIGGYWADAGCSQPLAIAVKSTTCPMPLQAPTMAVKLDTATCALGVYHFYSIGVPMTSAFSGTPGACTPIAPASVANYQLYSVGSEIPPTSFVAGTFTTDS